MSNATNVSYLSAFRDMVTRFKDPKPEDFKNFQLYLDTIESQLYRVKGEVNTKISIEKERHLKQMRVLEQKLEEEKQKCKAAELKQQEELKKIQSRFIRMGYPSNPFDCSQSMISQNFQQVVKISSQANGHRSEPQNQVQKTLDQVLNAQLNQQAQLNPDCQKSQFLSDPHQPCFQLGNEQNHKVDDIFKNFFVMKANGSQNQSNHNVQENGKKNQVQVPPYKDKPKPKKNEELKSSVLQKKSNSEVESLQQKDDKQIKVPSFLRAQSEQEKQIQQVLVQQINQGNSVGHPTNQAKAQDLSMMNAQPNSGNVNNQNLSDASSLIMNESLPNAQKGINISQSFNQNGQIKDAKSDDDSDEDCQGEFLKGLLNTQEMLKLKGRRTDDEIRQKLLKVLKSSKSISFYTVKSKCANGIYVRTNEGQILIRDSKSKSVKMADKIDSQTAIERISVLFSNPKYISSDLELEDDF